METLSQTSNEIENPFFVKMKRYLDQELIAGKKQIRELACDSVVIEWIETEERRKELRRMKVLDERLELFLKRFKTEVYALALISYQKEIIFKGLEPSSLKIFPNQTNPDESEDVVAALAYDKYSKKILVLYPHPGVPSRLNVPNGPSSRSRRLMTSSS